VSTAVVAAPAPASLRKSRREIFSLIVSLFLLHPV
jgi:hypothetical protein